MRSRGFIDRWRCCRHRHEFPSLLTATADVGTLTLGLSISADFGLSLSDLAQEEAIKLQVADIHGHSMAFPIYIYPHIHPYNIQYYTIYFPTHRSFQIHVRLYVWSLHLWSGSFLFIDLFVFLPNHMSEWIKDEWMDGHMHLNVMGFFWYLVMYRKHPETTAKSWASSLYILRNHEQSIELVSADCPWRRQLSFPHRYHTSHRVLWMIRYFSILLMHTIWL